MMSREEITAKIAKIEKNRKAMESLERTLDELSQLWSEVEPGDVVRVTYEYTAAAVAEDDDDDDDEPIFSFESQYWHTSKDMVAIEVIKKGE